MKEWEEINPVMETITSEKKQKLLGFYKLHEGTKCYFSIKLKKDFPTRSTSYKKPGVGWKYEGVVSNRLVYVFHNDVTDEWWVEFP